jgi:lipopolysaccharide biosynthesis protein
MKMLAKRLFLFAAYDPAAPRRGVVDDSLLVYLRELSRLGDIVLYMDNDVDPAQMKKLAPYVLHAGASRHGEYDFGSYKRAYLWARGNLRLADYDWVYMVNDSVYAPTRPLRPTIVRLESAGRQATGMVCNPSKRHPHIQSWFIGMSPAVFNAKWFDEFIRDVRPQSQKGSVTNLYEHGFTRHLLAKNIPWVCEYTIKNRGVYNRIEYLFRRGFPFIKKSAFTRHNGALGRQILRVLNRAPRNVRSAVIQNAARVWGSDYVSHLLTNNPLKTTGRGIAYVLHKILTKGGL